MHAEGQVYKQNKSATRFFHSTPNKDKTLVIC